MRRVVSLFFPTKWDAHQTALGESLVWFGFCFPASGTFTDVSWFNSRGAVEVVERCGWNPRGFRRTQMPMRNIPSGTALKLGFRAFLRGGVVA